MKISGTFIVFLAALLSSAPNVRAMQSGKEKIGYYQSTGIPQLPNNANLCYLNAVVQVLYNNDLLRSIIKQTQTQGSLLLNEIKNVFTKLEAGNAFEVDMNKLALSLGDNEANPSAEQIESLAQYDLLKIKAEDVNKKKIQHGMDLTSAKAAVIRENQNFIQSLKKATLDALSQKSAKSALDFINQKGQEIYENFNPFDSNVVDAIKRKFGILEVDPIEFVRPLFEALTTFNENFKTITQISSYTYINNRISTSDITGSPIEQKEPILIINVDPSDNTFADAVSASLIVTIEGGLKSTKIKNAPKILTIDVQNNARRDDPRASNPSIFPALNIKNFLVNQSNPDYQLSGAVIYIAGGNLNEPGHYKAAIKKGTQWFICENENIALVNENVALADIKAGATILLYQNTAAVQPIQTQPSQPAKPQVKPAQPVAPQQKKPTVVKSGQTQEEIKQQQQYWVDAQRRIQKQEAAQLRQRQQEETERQRRAEEERRRQELQRAEAARRAQQEEARRGQQQAQQRTTSPSASQTLKQSLQELTNAFGRLSRQLQVRYY